MYIFNANILFQNRYYIWTHQKEKVKSLRKHLRCSSVNGSKTLSYVVNMHDKLLNKSLHLPDTLQIRSDTAYRTNLYQGSQPTWHESKESQRLGHLLKNESAELEIEPMLASKFWFQLLFSLYTHNKLYYFISSHFWKALFLHMKRKNTRVRKV